MKRCPECGREYDNTMMFCLDDGAELLYGPARSEPGAIATGFPADEPQTAILHSTAAPGEAPTRAQINTTDQTAILQRGAEAEPRESLGGLSERQSLSAHRAAKPLIAGAIAIAVLFGCFFGYRYLAPTKQIESIAVMPFVNESGNPDIEYLSDGMTETLIRSLSQLANLQVKPRSSVFRYKGKETDAKTIGKELNVQAILNGRVTQRGDQLTLNLELIDVQKDVVLWSEQYNRKQTDLVSLQSEIAKDVSTKLKLKLSGTDEQRLVKRSPDNAEAYQLYLKGRFYWDKQTESSYKEAIGYFNQALEKDPNYALAYAGLANTYIALGVDYSSPKDVFPPAKLYAQKALDLAPELAEAHAALGSISFFYDWNWSAAERELRQVIEVGAENVEPYACTLHFLDSAGQPDQAVAEVKRVAVEHPASVVINAEVGCSSYYAHRYDEAIIDLQQTLEMDPNFAPAYYNLGRAYGQKRMYKEAINSLTKAKALSPTTPYMIAELGYAYAASGNKAAALDILRDLEKGSATRYVDAYLMAVIYIGLGDRDRALNELEKAFQTRSTWMIWLKVEPKFEPLHSDPRFQGLLDRVGF